MGGTGTAELAPRPMPRGRPPPSRPGPASAQSPSSNQPRVDRAAYVAHRGHACCHYSDPDRRDGSTTAPLPARRLPPQATASIARPTDGITSRVRGTSSSSGPESGRPGARTGGQACGGARNSAPDSYSYSTSALCLDSLSQKKQSGNLAKGTDSLSQKKKTGVCLSE